MSKQTNKNHTEDRIDFDHVIFQALVNEGKHLKVLHARRPPLQYNEKDLREAAHAEVANSNGQIQAEEIEKGNKKRKNMDATERAQQSRDRNREHAKNTRLRKKAYVAKLKELVDHMQKVKDAEESERVHLGEKIYETQVIRKNAVKLFMSYRASNIKDRAMWSQILDESVTLVLPITPYRSFHKGEIKYSSRVLHGIDAVIVDTASLNLMAECIGQSSPEWKEALKRNESCRVTFHTTPEDILAAGDLVMCRYVMRIDGCDMVGGGVESCVQHGMMTCKFDRHNKILSVENMFDVMGYMQQLQRAAAISPESSIVPNTLDMALQPSKECQAIVKAVMPYPVLHINEAWTNLTGSSQSAAEGMILSQALRVYPFQNNLIFRLAADCVLGRAGSTIFMSNDASHKSEQQSQQAVSSSLSGSNSFNDNSSFGTGTNSNNNNNNNNNNKNHNDKSTNVVSSSSSSGNLSSKSSGSDTRSSVPVDPAGAATSTTSNTRRSEVDDGSSSSSSSSGSNDNHDNKNEKKNKHPKSDLLPYTPSVRYLKLLPLTSDTDQITHFLATLVPIPLTAQESEEAAMSIKAIMCSAAAMQEDSYSHYTAEEAMMAPQRKNGNNKNSNNMSNASSSSSSSSSSNSGQSRATSSSGSSSGGGSGHKRGTAKRIISPPAALHAVGAGNGTLASPPAPLAGASHLTHHPLAHHQSNHQNALHGSLPPPPPFAPSAAVLSTAVPPTHPLMGDPAAAVNGFLSAPPPGFQLLPRGDDNSVGLTSRVGGGAVPAAGMPSSSSSSSSSSRSPAAAAAAAAYFGMIPPGAAGSLDAEASMAARTSTSHGSLGSGNAAPSSSSSSSSLPTAGFSAFSGHSGVAPTPLQMYQQQQQYYLQQQQQFYQQYQHIQKQQQQQLDGSILPSDAAAAVGLYNSSSTPYGADRGICSMPHMTAFAPSAHQQSQHIPTPHPHMPSFMFHPLSASSSSGGGGGVQQPQATYGVPSSAAISANLPLFPPPALPLPPPQVVAAATSVPATHHPSYSTTMHHHDHPHQQSRLAPTGISSDYHQPHPHTRHQHLHPQQQRNHQNVPQAHGYSSQYLPQQARTSAGGQQHPQQRQQQQQQQQQRQQQQKHQQSLHSNTEARRSDSSGDQIDPLSAMQAAMSGSLSGVMELANNKK